MGLQKAFGVPRLRGFSDGPSGPEHVSGEWLGIAERGRR